MPADLTFFFRRLFGAVTLPLRHPRFYRKRKRLREDFLLSFGQIAKQHPRQLLAALCLAFVLLSTPPVYAQDTSPPATPLITTPTSLAPDAAPTATSVIIVVVPVDATPAAPSEPRPAESLAAPALVGESDASSFWPLAVQIFEAAVRALSWLWFVCGSLVFFITAGIFAGLGLQRQPRGRYALLALPNHNTFNSFAAEDVLLDESALGNFALSENRPLADKEFVEPLGETKAPRRTSPSKPTATDDYWPTSLP